MNSKERVFTIVNHNETDRVPFDYWASPEVTSRLLKELGLNNEEELLKYLDVDLRYIRGPSYAGQEMKKYDDGTVEDLWGVRRRIMIIEKDGYKWTYKHVASSPLEHITDTKEIDEYEKWPSTDGWNYSQVEIECEQFKNYAIVNAGDRLDRTAQLKPMMYLRGMEQTFVDLYQNQKIAEAIISHIKEYFLEYNRRVFETAKGKIDIFMMGDDFGTQNGPMMNLNMWKRFFKKGFKQYIELAHKYGIKVMHHTCGSVKYLIPEFIDCSLDILQSLQPNAYEMDLKTLKKEYGKYIAFHGSVDIQHTLPKGSKNDIIKEVRNRMESAKEGGGFIISTAHNIQPDTPTENILTLFKAYKEYGKY